MIKNLYLDNKIRAENLHEKCAIKLTNVRIQTKFYLKKPA